MSPVKHSNIRLETNDLHDKLISFYLLLMNIKKTLVYMYRCSVFFSITISPFL